MSEKRVSVRVDDDLKRLVKNIVAKTKISETALVEATLQALCDYFEEHGEVTLPLVVFPQSALKKNRVPSAVRRDRRSSSETVLHGANEPEGIYQTRKKRRRAA